MAGTTPTFTYRNRCGVYCFQRRIPTAYRDRTKSLPRFVRLSLATRQSSVASRLARALSVMMDLRAQQYFTDEEAFHKAMKLFQEYVSAQTKYKTFEAMQTEFFDHLDDTTGDDSNLLERAANYYHSKQLDQGHSPYAQQIADLTALLKAKITHPVVKSTAISLDQAFVDFLMNAKVSWKESGGMETGYRDVYFPLFKEVVGDIQTDELTKSHIIDFIKVLQRMPSNRRKHANYSNMHAREFLSIDVPVAKRLSPITLKKYLGQISRFLHWLRSNDYTQTDLHLPLTNVKVAKTRSVDQQSAYTHSDLKKIFNSDAYLKGLHTSAHHFWVPLIGLYTGARLNEICQLEVKDLYKEPTSGHWVFDINENKNSDPNKSLKKPYHARLVPIHKRLIDLGSLDYLEEAKRKRVERLFPELPYVGPTNKYGDKLQRWFNRTYTGKNQCNITTPNTSFHSLRHTVITHLVNEKGVDANKIAVGFGQSHSGGVTQTTYSKTATLKDYKVYFDSIDFDSCYDYKSIRKWDKHTYALKR